MNSDSFYSIGYMHTVCQDYAIHGKNGDEHYAIVCDGCSSSKDSDIGARLLAHLSKPTMPYASVRFHPVDKLLKIINSMTLPVECLDSTIIMAEAFKDEAHVSIWGDGGFYVEFKDGHYEYYFVEYSQNAPFYFSYVLNNTVDQYYKIFPDQKVTLKKVTGIDGSESTTIHTDLTEFKGKDLFNRLQFVFKDVSFVSVFSDGVKSFLQQLTDGQMVPVDEHSIILHFTDYKNFQGEFTKRRMNKMKSENIKNSRIHYDDISVATIHMG